MGVQILIGLLICFTGYRMFKAVLAFYGFLIGAALGGAAGAAIGGSELLPMMIGGIAGGIIFGVLAVLLYFVGVFLTGAGLGVFAAMLIPVSSGPQPNPILMLLLGIICGVLALILQKLIIILSTSLVGAGGIVYGAAYFITSGKSLTYMNDPQAARTALITMFVVWLALGLAGVVVQYCVTGKKPHKRKEDEEEAPPKEAAAKEG